MAFDTYPSVDETDNFPPEIRRALAASDELKSMVIPMSQTDRNSLSGFQLWNNRLILNTTTSRINRYDSNAAAWVTLSTEDPGYIKAYAGPNPPGNVLRTDGTLVSRTGITAALFLAIGTTYNIGGEPGNMFRLPLGNGKTLVGLDTTEPSFDTLGKIIGEINHRTLVSELPPHSHTNAAHVHPDGGHSHSDSGHNHDSGWHVSAYEAGGYALFDGPTFNDAAGKAHNKGFVDRVAVSSGNGTAGTGTGRANISGNGAGLGSSGVVIDNTGDGVPHNNLQPSLIINYVITL